jgi:hypothetical protein
MRRRDRAGSAECGNCSSGSGDRRIQIRRGDRGRDDGRGETFFEAGDAALKLAHLTLQP